MLRKIRARQLEVRGAVLVRPIEGRALLLIEVDIVGATGLDPALERFKGGGQGAVGISERLTKNRKRREI